MTISRRNFIQKGSLVGISAVATFTLPSLAFGQSAGSKKPVSSGSGTVSEPSGNTTLDSLTRADFASVLPSTFIINHPTHGRIEVYLKDVEDLSPDIFKPHASKGIECFNLIFACQSTVELGQGTYQFEHEKLGTFELLIVPGKRLRYGRDYGAIINRLYP
ncbi:MAG: hypothetical protein AB1757_29475 [Acidobacteriota bacterium]